jgi:hypothetical protein
MISAAVGRPSDSPNPFFTGLLTSIFFRVDIRSADAVRINFRGLNEAPF